MSDVDRSWLLRNADVLVQLLQSGACYADSFIWIELTRLLDDPNEVTVVKRALTKHVDLDARSTLQVLCDQCVYKAEDLADEDERMLRARLRTLVLQFLAEKYHVCVDRAVKDREVEEILLKGMVGVSEIVKFLFLLPSLMPSRPFPKHLRQKYEQLSQKFSPTFHRSPKGPRKMELLSSRPSLALPAVRWRQNIPTPTNCLLSSPRPSILSPFLCVLSPQAPQRPAHILAHCRPWIQCECSSSSKMMRSCSEYRVMLEKRLLDMLTVHLILLRRVEIRRLVHGSYWMCYQHC